MSDDGPPPWLINMQRYGPPPSYPNLKIPGLSAPIPPGAAFGYHPGGWGKPPVDEYGNPIYGDVFGVYGTKEHDDRTPYDAIVDVADSRALALTAKPGVCQFVAGSDDHFLWTLSGARYAERATVIQEFLLRAIACNP